MRRRSSTGFGYLLLGFSMLTKPGIKRFVLIPLAINIALFAVLFFFAGHYFGDFVSWLDHKLPAWLHWLNWILWPVFVLSVLFVLAYFFVIIANIISAPFNSFLAEKVEWIETGHKPNPEDTVTDAAKDIPRVLSRELSKLKYYLPRAVVLLILFLIPGVNVVATVLWFIFGCWSMCMQYLDYPMDNHKVSLALMRKAMRQHLGLSLSFGCAVVIVLMIPVLNFLVIPAAVIGATLMWLDYRQQWLSDSASANSTDQIEPAS